MRNIFLAAAAALALSFPAAAKSAATEVQCTDGTTGKAGRGACSRHGGVAKAAIPPAAKAAPVEPSTGAPAAQQRTRTESKDPQSNTARAPGNGSVLGGIFGRRDTSDTPLDARVAGGEEPQANGHLQGRHDVLLGAPLRHLLGARRRADVAGQVVF